MSNTGFFRRISLILLSATLILSVTSCARAASQQTPAPPAQPSPGALSPSDSATNVPSPFISHLTENGTGLVRDIPAGHVVRSAADTMNDVMDIRWLDCPKNMNDSQIQKLKSTVPDVIFNSDTVWPPNLPSGFDPGTVMAAGKNPGLGVNALHGQGITGKGVSIAIIDQTLFTGHTEYKDNLALYEEIHVTPGETASMHGSAVSSIAVGKTCGVAPDARLYYWAVNFAKGQSVPDASDKYIAFADGLAVAVDRMLEVNAKLPANGKIRVLSISRGFGGLDDTGVQTFLKAVERAKAAGIFVITTSTFEYYDFMTQATDFAGLGKADFNGNPDDLKTYTLGSWEQTSAAAFTDKLLVPMDARTTADFTSPDDYVFYSEGGFSWVAPYLAGLYALSAQVKPDVTPELFWTTALNTAGKLTVKIPAIADGKEYTFNHIINPTALIDALK